MIRIISSAALIVFLSVAGAQEVPSEDEAATEEESTVEATDDFVFETDADHTQEDDDVFIPSDKVSFEQSVRFPTDI